MNAVWIACVFATICFQSATVYGGTTLAPSTNTSNTTDTTKSSAGIHVQVGAGGGSTGITTPSAAKSTSFKKATVVPTPAPTIKCTSGTCSGNSTCIANVKSTKKCAAKEVCFQTVTDDTDFAFGCSPDCTETHNETSKVETRCCSVDLCNTKLLKDTPGSSSQTRLSYFIISFSALFAFYLM